MRIAILSSVFLREFGVARVISSQLPYLVQAGFSVDLYVCEIDKSLLIPGVRAIRVPTHFRGLKKALLLGNYDVVIAHTDPFYRFLSEMKFSSVTIGYEHGNPPVELCKESERELRAKELLEKPSLVYPKLSKVVTISNYAKEYLNWKQAHVIYNGADHYEKRKNSFEQKDKKIKILSVCRFRSDEWVYKGLEDFCNLSRDLGKNFELTVVGRGERETVKRLQDCGIRVYSNVSAEKLADIYLESDALVSFSRWELFNLPLVEAGFAHKPAIALNLCAHPEVTPFVFDSYKDILEYLQKSTKESLCADGKKMFDYVDSRFRWECNGKALVELLQSLCPVDRHSKSAWTLKLIWGFWRVREFVRQHVYKKVLKK